MRGKDLARIARHPRLLIHMINAWVYEVRHPREPWWSPPAISLLDELLTREMTGLEWGSGRSTVWLAKRLGTLTSIEHVSGWHAKVASMVSEAGLDNVDLQLIEVPADPDEFGAAFWEENPYTMASERFDDESLDLVAVDGSYRMPCAWRAIPKIKPGGLLLIDDTLHSGWLEAWRIPPDWELLRGPGPGVWSTAIWRKPPS